MKSDSLSSTSESGSESSDDATEVPPDEAAKVPLARHGRDFEQGQHWFSVSERGFKRLHPFGMARCCARPWLCRVWFAAESVKEAKADSLCNFCYSKDLCTDSSSGSSSTDVDEL